MTATTHRPDTATVRTAPDGTPERVYWHDRRWRIIDTPTRLHGPVELPHGTTDLTCGWTFTVTPAGDPHAAPVTLDVDHTPDGWVILRTWR